MKKLYYLFLRYEGRHPDTPSGGAVASHVGWWIDGAVCRLDLSKRSPNRLSVEEAVSILKSLEAEGYTIRGLLLCNPAHDLPKMY